MQLWGTTMFSLRCIALYLMLLENSELYDGFCFIVTKHDATEAKSRKLPGSAPLWPSAPCLDCLPRSDLPGLLKLHKRGNERR